jgi:hypothetical protein
MSDESDAKSLRFFLFLAAIVILGGFFFAFKVDACRDKPAIKEPCKDEFFQIDNDHTSHVCSPGAKAEFISSPPAPRAGVVCHCIISPASVPDPSIPAAK